MAVTVDFAIKAAFFDRAAVINATRRNERRALSRIGAFVRRRARTDVLRRTAQKGQKGRVIRDSRGRFAKSGSARPGQPPIVRSRNQFATLRNIQFGLGDDGQSVLIGPLLVSQAAKRLRSNRATVPELMEFGGWALIDEFRIVDGRKGFWYAGRSSNPLAVHRKRRASYAPHPFMSVALEREVKAGTVLNAFSVVQGS
ncbi:MAG: hypothetical protein ACTHK7_21900 [Aureliella sp.]